MTLVAACLKWVAARTEIDAVTGAVHEDERAGGASAADRAALEWALRTAEHLGGDCVAIAAGPAVADDMLRDAVACGVDRAVRIDLPHDAPSEVVADVLAAALARCDVVWCGDHSPDRGSGSVPARLAARLGASQALGLVQVELDGKDVRALRRLDGGRRERLRVRAPAVLSVEGAAATLRRAPLAATLDARRAGIELRRGPTLDDHPRRPTRPFRPRPRSLPAPVGDTALQRIAALLHAEASAARSEPIELDADAAAERILAALREWSEIDNE